MGKYKKGKKLGKVSKAVKKYVKEELKDEFPLKTLCAQIFPAGQQFGNTAGTLACAEIEVPVMSNSSATFIARDLRTTNKIRVAKLAVKIVLGTTDPSHVVRFLLIQDRQCQGITAAGFASTITNVQGGLFDNSISTATTSPLWQYNSANVGVGSTHRYKVLYDKIMTLNNDVPVATNAYRHVIKINKRFKAGLKQVFNDVTVNTDFQAHNCSSGIVWCVMLSDSAAAATLTIVNSSMAIDFRDMD